MTEDHTIPASMAVPADPPVRILDEDECWRLLAASSLGRFAVRVGDGVDVFPVNYLTHGRELYFRSGPGSKLMDLTREPLIAFEIDGERAHYVWSVVVHGTAQRMAVDSEIEESGVQALKTWQGGEKANYVRIRPESVSGRSFVKSPSLR